MTKNPIINAGAAALYIIAIAVVMFFGTKNIPQEDTIISPIAGISLFTFSAGVMGYIFVLKPFQLYLDGEKKEAVNLFLQTLGVFGAITAVILLILFSGVLS